MSNLAVLLSRGADGLAQDLPAAREWYRRAADLGNHTAMLNLALLYQTGAGGLDKDLPAAAALYRAAADLGSADAMEKLALLLQSGGEGLQKDVPAAVALFQKAADHGNDSALCSLAILLQSGENGVDKDVPAAAALFQRAVDRGNDYAMSNLAVLLQRGENGVQKDIPAALALFRRAVDCGNPTAMHNLALLFQNGDDGVEKDVPAAVALFRQAADLGNVTAMFNLGVIYRDGADRVARDPAEAFALFQRGANHGDVNSMCGLGILLEHGIGTTRDTAGALQWMERAAQAEPNHALIKTSLARLLLSDEVEALRNPPRAAQMLEDALEQNPTFGYALHELAVLCSYPEQGISQDREKAERLFSLAASKASYEGVIIYESERIVIEAGEHYPEVIKEILRGGFAKPKTCLLLTLGGGGRGKTSTVNSLRGLSFVSDHVPTEMAALNKFVVEPGARGLAERAIEELDFNENSLLANASRVHKQIVRDTDLHSRNEGASPKFSSKRICSKDTNHQSVQPHADVIERVRRSLLKDKFPVRCKGCVMQVWDMAGQSEYEMAHSMVIARGSILVFVTDLERVSNEETRNDEVALLCRWMELAHILVPNPSRTRILVVGTRKDECPENALRILKESVGAQLAASVYNSWVMARQRESCNAEIPVFIAIENSKSQANPASSGLEALERAVKALGDEVVAQRDVVPLRWLAFVDKLEREHRRLRRVYFSRDDVRRLSAQFPGFADDDLERERDVLEGLRCFASMARVVLFELGDEEWYVFVDVDKIVGLLGRVTAPDERKKDRLRIEDIRSLADGRISQSGLFSLWDGLMDEEKRLMLKLLCQFDLLMLLEEGDDCVDNDNAVIGVPALMPSGWDSFKWGIGEGEKDLEVTSKFEEAIPNGLMGFLIAHVHRRLVVEDGNGAGISGTSLKVRANAALMKVKDGSRMFVGLKPARRELCWKFRGLEPITLARQSIRVVEELMLNPSRIMCVGHRHVIAIGCDGTRGGCGAEDSVEVELSKEWILEDRARPPMFDNISCQACYRPWKRSEIYGVLWPTTEATVDLRRMQPVMSPRKYDVFISHAGPDKLTVAEPLYKGLAWHGVRAFLDKEGLQMHEATAPEEMERAMGEARVGIFILSPEFAGRDWTLRELRRFLERDKQCAEEGCPRPVLLPIFFRLSVCDCARSDSRVYGDGGTHADAVRRAGFFQKERQQRCSTEQAVTALKKLRTYSGVEVARAGGGEDLSSASVVAETVRRVVDFMRTAGML